MPHTTTANCCRLFSLQVFILTVYSKMTIKFGQGYRQWTRYEIFAVLKINFFNISWKHTVTWEC